METNTSIRTERNFTHYSRGAELARAIRTMWDANSRLPAGSNQEIADRIDAIMAEFDLTVEEWHHWARHCSAWEVS